MSVMRPIPTGHEIKLDSRRYIVSKTDIKGTIVYGNDYFTEISGYKEFELIGSPHNIIRHPDMPKAIFYTMWEHLRKNQNITAVVKNMAKNGDHYWVVTDFEIKRDRNGNIQNYTAFRHPASRDVIKKIEPLYQKMLEIENTHSMDASIEYLEGYLQEHKMNYNQFIEKIAKPTGLTAVFVNAMKKLFG